MAQTLSDIVAPDAVAAAVDAALAENRADPTRLLQILIATQARLLWLPAPAITLIAARLGLSRARVEGVAGFYSFLYQSPVGRYRALFADNIIENMQGARALMALLCEKLGVAPGALSRGGAASVDYTSCIGMSDQGPSMLVNGRTLTALTPQRIEAIAALIQAEEPLERWPAEFFAVADNIRRRDMLLASRLAPGEAMRRAIALGPEALLAEVKTSNLRGRGGAGFSTAQKWAFCRAAEPPEGGGRVVVCNADEGEPGTFKDRVLLTHYADHVFEGMTLAAYALGASQGFLYLRGEYLYLRAHLEDVLARRRREGLLGCGILGADGFDFDIDIHLGAGAYVCGEETALIESLEGKRGTPRIRPPFPVTRGYLGQPTAVNNVETLALVTLIAAHGGDAFAKIGTPQSTGTKLLSISGDCAAPGVYEFPFGATIAEVLESCGARDVQAAQLGGAAGVTLAPAEFSRRIAFEDAPTAGALMIFDNSRDMFEVAHNFAHFFAHESCGFCTPCRVGTALLKDSLDKLGAGRGALPDLAEIDRLDRVLQRTSHCGLGQAAANPVLDGLKKFHSAYAMRARRPDFQPAFSLDEALAPARALTGRDDAFAHFAEGEE
ncbi:NAD(P)H-dependent oxidoreductase subunit E [Methylocystis sp. 9N]|uniref:NAD(P)H-dependent oxidoreductase subunit E n=1 Tax=Methylocystis borbori TaxID=3118750 RepID=A0ABU7XJR3_9HYPH